MQLQRKADELRRALQSIDSLSRDKAELSSRLDALGRQLAAKDATHAAELASAQRRNSREVPGPSKIEVTHAQLRAIDTARAEAMRLARALADAECEAASARRGHLDEVRALHAQLAASAPVETLSPPPISPSRVASLDTQINALRAELCAGASALAASERALQAARSHSASESERASRLEAELAGACAALEAAEGRACEIETQAVRARERADGEAEGRRRASAADSHALAAATAAARSERDAAIAAAVESAAVERAAALGREQAAERAAQHLAKKAAVQLAAAVDQARDAEARAADSRARASHAELAAQGLKVELDTARPALAHARAELERVRAQLARSQGAERQLQQQQQQAAASSGGMGVAEEAALRAELEALRLALLEARAELARSASEWASKEEEWRLVSLKRYAQSSHADERLKLLAKSEAHLKRRLDMMQLAMHAVERSLDPERAAKIRAQIAERETQLEAQFALKSVHTLALKRETFADTVGQQMRAIDSKLQRLASCSPTPSAGAPSGTTLPRLSSNN